MEELKPENYVAKTEINELSCYGCAFDSENHFYSCTLTKEEKTKMIVKHGDCIPNRYIYTLINAKSV